MKFSRDFKFQPGNRVARELVLEAASRGLEFRLSTNHAMRAGKYAFGTANPRPSGARNGHGLCRSAASPPVTARSRARKDCENENPALLRALS